MSILLFGFRLGEEMMERLTKTYSDGTHGAADNLPCGENSYIYKGLLLEALGKYEDAEEQGLLLRLPCRVGDIVYCICERYIKFSEYGLLFEEYPCQGCECLECDSHKELYMQPQKAYTLDWIVSNLKRFGKTVFLTQEEAEQKLKEMEVKEDLER